MTCLRSNQSRLTVYILIRQVKRKWALTWHQEDHYQLLVDWASGDTSWVNYQIIFKDDPISMSLYALRGTVSLAYLVGRTANVTFVMSRSWLEWQTRSSLGPIACTPSTNTACRSQEATKKPYGLTRRTATLNGRMQKKVELDQLHEYKTFIDLGKGSTRVPAGFKKIPCHIVYDFKCSESRKKASLCRGWSQDRHPHWINLCWSHVITRNWNSDGHSRTQRFGESGAPMSEMPTWSQKPMKRWFSIAGDKEFGPLAEHLFQIVKALYSLKVQWEALAQQTS